MESQPLEITHLFSGQALRQMVLAAVIDGEVRPLRTKMLAGKVAVIEGV